MTSALTSSSVQSRLDALPVNDDWGVAAAALLLGAAHGDGFSDLHLQPSREGLLARGRRDGELVPLARIPAARRDLLLSRFKVMARLAAFVRNEPQDGRIEWKPEGAASPLILRAAFLPMLHGESLVVRFPREETGLSSLESLGMTAPVRAAFEEALQTREGTLLLTGPGGSGKTTTLYALLRALHDRHGDRLNMLSIEDPVERDLPFAGQVQVNEAQGMTFDKALRAALRQDPNVLLIGEIRDTETARIAIQAGTSGHLVLSTLHAGRAARVFTRLLSMGVEPYQAASALIGAGAQRLARCLCPECRVPARGVAGMERGPGCEACGGTGHAGRAGLFELARVTEPLRELILARAGAHAIAEAAAERQAGDLAAQARDLVAAGTISQAEADFVLGPGDFTL